MKNPVGQLGAQLRQPGHADIADIADIADAQGFMAGGDQFDFQYALAGPAGKAVDLALTLLMVSWRAVRS